MARSRFLFRAAVTLSSPVFSAVLAGIIQLLTKSALPLSPRKKQKAAHISHARPLKSALSARLADRNFAGLYLLRLGQPERENSLLDARRNLRRVDAGIELEHASEIFRTRLAVDQCSVDLRQ